MIVPCQTPDFHRTCFSVYSCYPVQLHLLCIRQGTSQCVTCAQKNKTKQKQKQREIWIQFSFIPVFTLETDKWFWDVFALQCNYILCNTIIHLLKSSMWLWLAAEMGSDAHVSAVLVLVVHYHLHNPVKYFDKKNFSIREKIRDQNKRALAVCSFCKAVTLTSNSQLPQVGKFLGLGFMSEISPTWIIRPIPRCAWKSTWQCRSQKPENKRTRIQY